MFAFKSCSVLVYAWLVCSNVFCPGNQMWRYLLNRVHICTRMQCKHELGVPKWENCWCGCVTEAQRTALVFAVNVWWTAENLSFLVDTSKKNTFANILIGPLWKGRTNLEHCLVYCLGDCQTNHFLYVWDIFVRVCLSPACLIHVCVQMWTQFYNKLAQPFCHTEF